LFFERQSFSGADPQRILTSLVRRDASTAIGFGWLARARAGVERGIGATMAVGAFLSLAFAALLTGREQAHMQASPSCALHWRS